MGPERRGQVIAVELGHAIAAIARRRAVSAASACETHSAG